MRTLIVLSHSAYGIHFNVDCCDKADITYCHARNFKEVKDQRFDTIIHVGSNPSLKTRKQFQTLIEE